MTITSISALNRAEKRLADLSELASIMGLDPGPETLSLASEIKRYRYHQGIQATCGTCGAHSTTDQDFAVHAGGRMCPAKLYARVCQYRKKEAVCLNTTEINTKQAVEEFGWKPIDPNDLKNRLSLEVAFGRGYPPG